MPHRAESSRQTLDQRAAGCCGGDLGEASGMESLSGMCRGSSPSVLVDLPAHPLQHQTSSCSTTTSIATSQKSRKTMSHQDHNHHHHIEPPYHRHHPHNMFSTPYLHQYHKGSSSSSSGGFVHRVEPSPSDPTANHMIKNNGFARSSHDISSIRTAHDLEFHPIHNNSTRSLDVLDAKNLQNSTPECIVETIRLPDRNEAITAASVLLFAAATTTTTVPSETNCDNHSREKNGMIRTLHDHPSTESSDLQECSEGNVPLKKRKKHLDFLRRNQQENTILETPTAESHHHLQQQQHQHRCHFDDKGQPCHISPASSLGGASVNHMDEPNPTDEVTPLSSSETAPATATMSSPTNELAAASLVHSRHDLDDETPQHHSRKQQQPSGNPVSRTNTDGSDTYDVPPNVVLVPDFPMILHHVLAQPELNNVLQWLPHGKAWRILRWDALRREVLPKFFPQLREEDGTKQGCYFDYGSIDAFLWHLRAWGFEEIKDGAEAGAYRHEMFLRESPDLCENINWSNFRTAGYRSPPRSIREHSHPTSTTNDPGHVRSILRVPSLLTKPDTDVAPKFSVSPITRPGATAIESTNGFNTHNNFMNVGETGIDFCGDPPSSNTIRLSPSTATTNTAAWPRDRWAESFCLTYRPNDNMAMASYADGCWIPQNNNTTSHPPTMLLHGQSMSRCPPPPPPAAQHFDLRYSSSCPTSTTTAATAVTKVNTESGPYITPPPTAARQLQQHQSSNRSRQYSSAQVRSGRGALRNTSRHLHRDRQVSSNNHNPYDVASVRSSGNRSSSSFPVSHRGRGGPSWACRVPIPPADVTKGVDHNNVPLMTVSMKMNSNTDMTTRESLEQAATIDITTFADKAEPKCRISKMDSATAARNTKRKLPLTRNVSVSETIAEP